MSGYVWLRDRPKSSKIHLFRQKYTTKFLKYFMAIGLDQIAKGEKKNRRNCRILRL